MTGAEAVLVCAIQLLGRSPDSMPPIEVVASPPFDVSPKAEAFVRRGEPTIYVIASAAAVRDASCGRWRSLIRLASVLVHEESHVRGSDERAAYDAQLLAILRLGEPTSSRLYRSVYQSMQTVLDAQKQADGRAKAQKEAAEAERAIARR